MRFRTTSGDASIRIDVVIVEPGMSRRSEGLADFDEVAAGIA